jgi:hypothetical protein
MNFTVGPFCRKGPCVPRRHRSDGKSLLEALVLISILSLVVALSATSLTTLFRIRHQMSRDREQGATISRLATRLRLDAHEADSVSLNDGCMFSLTDGRTIHYSFDAPNLVRQVRRDTTLLHRDRFLLPKSATAAFERDGDLPPALVRLSIRPIEVRTRRTEMPRTATIEAAVGPTRTIAQNGRQP